MVIALHIEYKGTVYYGFQSQTGLPTIQGTLESALSKIADAPIQITCAGRTDAGVHATAQVIHFTSPIERELRAWVLGTNAFLPKDISVQKAFIVADDFHARYRATHRTYRYIIDNSAARSGLWHNYSTYFPLSLDTKSMQQAADYLIGEHDFTSFRGADCQAKTPHRQVHYCRVERKGHWVIIDIQANAFLHHMVRNIVGTLVKVGKGIEKPEWMHSVLMSRDRKSAGQTMAPQGLYLVGVNYPSPHNSVTSLVWPQL